MPPSDRGHYSLRQRHTLPGITLVPFAQMGLTSLFGMGRGGHHRYSHHKYFILHKSGLTVIERKYTTHYLLDLSLRAISIAQL